MSRIRAGVPAATPEAGFDLRLKAASLLDSIVNSHPLIDGNKRLGWLATAVFLELNQSSVAGASNDDVYGLVMHVAANQVELAEVAEKLLLFATGE